MRFKRINPNSLLFMAGAAWERLTSFEKLLIINSRFSTPDWQTEKPLIN